MSKATKSRSAAKNRPERKLPVLGIVFAAVAVVLIVAVMFAGGEQLGGAEFGDPEITGASLPRVPDGILAEPQQDPAFGMTIPEVKGQNFDGEEVAIEIDGTPKAILLVSHSCPHCQDEITEVQAWLNSGGGVPAVDIVTVSTSANSAASNWPPSEWLERENWQAPVIADDSDNSVFVALGGQVIPYWVFVDGDGKVTRRNPGRMDLDGIQAAMQETLP